MLTERLLTSRLYWRSRSLNVASHKALVLSQRQLLAMPVGVVPMIALDLEMTGLKPGEDQILAIGVVPIRAGLIDLNGAEEIRIAIVGSVGQSAVIHGITDRELAGATSLEQAMGWLLERLSGHIVVAHHAPLDLAFIAKSCRKLYGEAPPIVAIDTLMLERQRLLKTHDLLPQGSLRLGACRQRYGLPVYSAHNALVDALGCGELLLAQLASRNAAALPVSQLVDIF